MGVILWVCALAAAVLRRAAPLAPATADVWKDSFLKRRWWMTLNLLRKASVLWDAGGKREGFVVSLLWC